MDELEVIEFEAQTIVPACTGADPFDLRIAELVVEYPEDGVPFLAGSAFANGQIPQSALRPIAGGGYLAPNAAAAWNAMAAKIFKETGQRISVNGPDSAYRNVARQIYWRNYWCSRGLCGNAAVPGTSNHGWGLAVDTWAQSLIAQFGAPFGWQKQWSDAAYEPWHFRYATGHFSGKDPGPGYDGPGSINHYPTLEKGDNGKAVKRASRHLHRWNVGMTRPNIDQFFGQGMKKATKEFQAVHSLSQDGKIGPRTWRALRRKDKLLNDERSHVNRIRLAKQEKRLNPKERDQLRALRDWCAKRAKSVKKIAEGGAGWKGQDREYRFKTLKAAAGDQY